MFDAQTRAGLAEGGRFVAADVVGHDRLDGDAELAIVRDDLLEKVDSGVPAFVVAHGGVAEARVIVDAHMQAPSCAPCCAASFLRFHDSLPRGTRLGMCAVHFLTVR